MGVIEGILANVDSAKRKVGRNIQDMISSPGLYAEKLGDAANTGLTPEEIKQLLKGTK